MLKLYPGDVVAFKTWDQMEKEFGLKENGAIACACTFTPVMEKTIDRTRDYIVESVEEPTGGSARWSYVFLKDFNSQYIASSDMLVLKNGDVIPLFEEDVKLRMSPIKTEGRFPCTNDNVEALFYGFALPLKDEAYLNTARYGAYGANPASVKMSFNVGGEAFIRFSKVDTINKEGHYFCRTHNFIIDKTTSGYVVYYTEWSNEIIIEVYYRLAKEEKVPVILDPEKGISQYLKDCDVYLDEAKEFLREAKRRKDLKAACDAVKTRRKQAMIDRIEDVKDLIERKTDEIRRLSLDVRQLSKDLLFFENTSSETDDFCQMITTSENIKNVVVSGNDISITVTQPLLFWEDEDFEDNKDGDTFLDISEEKQKLLCDIFENRSIELLIEQQFVMNIETAKIRSTRDYVSNNAGIPNPHHYYFNCWGDNEYHISKAIASGDLVTALSQAIAATASFALSDGTVWGKFINTELREFSDYCCLKDTTTGEIMTIEEYLEREE